MVLRITIDVQTDNIEGVKECLAMELEKYGDVKVMDVSQRDHARRKPETIGKRIQKARMAAVMTQRELAEAIYVHESLISQWENGRKVPSADQIKEIAAACDVNPQWLTHESEERWR